MSAEPWFARCSGNGHVHAATIYPWLKGKPRDQIQYILLTPMNLKLHYATGRTPRVGYKWRDWYRLFTIVGVLAILPFCLGMFLDSEYVFLGVLIFATGGVALGRSFPSRLVPALITSALAAAAVSIIFYAATSYQIVVDNQSGQRIPEVEIIRDLSASKSIGIDFDLPANTKLELPFHAMRFNGVLTVMGTFADGTSFQQSSWGLQRRGGGYSHTTIVFTALNTIRISQK